MAALFEAVEVVGEELVGEGAGVIEGATGAAATDTAGSAATSAAADVGGAEVEGAATAADTSATSAASRTEAEFYNGGKPYETTEMRARAQVPRAKALAIAGGAGIMGYEVWHQTEQTADNLRDKLDRGADCIEHFGECTGLDKIPLPSMPDLPGVSDNIGRAIMNVPGMNTAMNVFGVALPLAVLAGFGFVGFRTYHYFSKG